MASNTSSTDTAFDHIPPLRRADEKTFLDSFNNFLSRAKEDTVLTHDGIDYSCLIHRSKFYCIESEISGASSAEFTFKLRINGTPAAIVQLSAYRLNGCSGRVFVETCDATCQQMYDMATVLNYNFILDKLRKKDVILSLDRIAVHPDFEKKGLISSLLHYALSEIGVTPVITVVHAFPLQYEGSGRCDEPEFSHLQSGLTAYYKKVLKAAPVVSSHKDDGWMYTSTFPINEWADLY